MSLFPRPVNTLCSLSQPSKPPGDVGESSDDVMPLVSQQQAECFITSASIPGGLLRAALGVPGKGMIQKSPPQEGEELGLEEEPLVGRKRMQSQNKASFVQFCSLFYLVSEPILNFK